MASLALVAITHQSAPLALLEQVSLSAEQCAELSSTLCRSAPGVSEAIVLSTCNRTEIYVAGPHPHHAGVLDVLADLSGVDRTALAAIALKAVDDEASLHLLRVAAGLESRVVGEGEILGQVRAAFGRAVEDGTVGPRLAGLFRWAASTGRRARRVSASVRAPSLAAIVSDTVGAAATVLVVGAGAMAGAVTGELGARRIPYLVCARRADEAARLGRATPAAVPFDGLHDALDGVDVVVCATSARSPVLSAADVARAMRRRGGRPLTIVDLGLPRNVTPAAGHVDGVRLLDLEGLTSNRGDLHLRRAAQVVAAEHRRYLTWLAGQAAGADIARLRAHVLDVCRSQLELELGAVAVGPSTLDRIAHAVAGALAHTPTVVLKDLVAHGDDGAAAAVLAAFGVEAAARAGADADAGVASVEAVAS